MKEEQLSDFFGICRDSSRLQIITLLHDGELCVCDIIEKIQLKQNLVSHHLSVLKNAGILNVRKDGVRRFYSITPYYHTIAHQAIEFLSHII